MRIWVGSYQNASGYYRSFSVSSYMQSHCQRLKFPFQVSSPNCNLKKLNRPIPQDPIGSLYSILQATEHAQNHVAADLMLKSCILFISLDRNNDYIC